MSRGEPFGRAPGSPTKPYPGIFCPGTSPSLLVHVAGRVRAYGKCSSHRNPFLSHSIIKLRAYSEKPSLGHPL
jgi:hypothetical protein